MTSLSGIAEVHSPANRLQSSHWPFAGFIGFYTLLAVVGFTPRSLAILDGERANPALAIHVHAACMALWFCLLTVQSLLAATGNTRWHRQLGRSAFVLTPLVLIGMLAAAFHQYGVNLGNDAPEAAARSLLLQIRAVGFFALFITWALVVRRRDSETHKRMVLLATVVVIPAALSRMSFLPNALPQTPDLLHCYMIALLLPPIAFDLWRYGSPHRAYIIGVLLMLPWLVATHYLWNSPWWLSLPAQ